MAPSLLFTVTAGTVVPGVTVGNSFTITDPTKFKYVGVEFTGDENDHLFLYKLDYAGTAWLPYRDKYSNIVKVTKKFPTVFPSEVGTYALSGNIRGTALAYTDEYGTERTDVALQDQTTPAIIFPFNRITNGTTLTADTVIDEYTLNVASTTGIIEQTALVQGSFIIAFSDVTHRFFQARVIDVTGLVVTVDRPIDSIIPSGSNVDITTTEMNVDGSTTPVIFGLRGPSVPGQIEIEADITRMMIGVLTDTIGDLSEFGDLASLTRGVLVRKRDGTIQNIFQWKNNGELATTCYDLETYVATNPAQGVNGFTARLTFAGQNKIGVVIRLGPGEDLEVHIQDNLAGLVRFGILAEGHVVD